MRSVLIFCLLLPLPGMSQLLDNSKGTAFTEVPFFNEAFVRNNRLKSIRGTYTFKKLDDIMRETKYVAVYDFNPRGQLVRSYETGKNIDRKDTLVLFYGYDARGNLAFVRRKDSKGYWSTHYEYDSLNRKIREEYRRDIDTAGTLLVPVFERSTVLNVETMTYQKGKDEQTATISNNYGFPYMTEVSHYDPDGYLLSRDSRLKMTSQTVTTVYGYTEKGWISKITTISSANPKANEELLFKYDAQGNLTEKHVYRNGAFTTDIQVIYSQKTGLISSILTRDVATNFISILRFDEYEYF